MPQVIGGVILSAFGVSAATAGTAIVVGGIATGLTYASAVGAVVMIGGSIAYSSSQNARLRRAFGTAGLDQGRSIMVRDPIAPRRLIYGKVRVSGTIIFLHTTGTKNEYLHLVIVLAGHECADIGDIYFNDELVELSGATPTGKYNAVARINKHLGTSGEAADSDLVSETGGLWTSNHKVSGCAYLAVRLKWSPDLFPNGLPTISAVVRGKKVYDPRTATTAWSDNAALCAGDFLMDSTWGRGVALARIRDADWEEAANICDENVVLGDVQSKTCNVASGNRHVGCSSPSGILPGYKVSGTGIAAGTEVVSVDASGLFFTVDRDPTATNASVTLTIGAGEARYTCNGVVTADQQPAEVLRDLAGSMAGCLVDTGGLWTIRAGAWRTPVLTLTDSDLSGPVSVTPRQSRQDTFNGVKGVFISPANDWSPADFPVVKNDTYMADDGGVRLWLDTQYNFTTSPAMAQRLAKIELERGRQQIVVNGRYMLKAMQLMPGDVVAVTRARLGWSAKHFEVVEWQFEQVGGADAPSLAVALTLRETAEGVWDWADGEETTIDLAPNTTLPDPYTVPTPTGLGVASASIMQSDGNVLPRLTVSWTATTNIYVEQGGSVAIEYKRTADSVWIEWARVRGDIAADVITGLVIGTGYDVRLRFINSLGVRGSYCSTVSATVTGDVTAAGVPSGLTAVVGTGKSVSLSWAAVTDIDLSEYRVYRSTSNVFGSATLIAETGSNRFVDVDVTIGTTYYYWVASVDFSENVSSPSSSASGTPTSVGSGSPPSDPSALSLVDTGTYVAGDGTVFGRINVSVPAMPAGAIVQNVLYRRNGATEWKIAAQLTNTSSTGLRVDDLSTDTSWDFATQAHNGAGSSAVVDGTGIPFAVTHTTTVSAPTSGSLAADGSEPSVKSDLTAVMFGCRAAWSWTGANDLASFEIKVTTTNSDGATDYSWAGAGLSNAPFKVPRTQLSAVVYNAVAGAGYVRVRAVDTTGNASSWLSIGNANSACVQAVNNMALQAADDIETTGITTGSSANKVAIRHPLRGTYSLDGGGGGTTDTITITIAAGFSVAPDVGRFQSDNTTANIRYDWDDSTSTSIVLRIRSLDGSNLPATMNIDGELIDYV